MVSSVILRMFLIETFVLLDCIKIDNATITSHNDNVWNTLTDLTRYDTYSELANASANSRIRTSVTLGTVIEFYAQPDNISNNYIRFYDNDIAIGYFNNNAFADDNNSLHHCKIEIDSNGNVNVSSNDSTKTYDFTLSSIPSEDFLFEFNLLQNVNSVKFKEFKIYPV